MAFLSFMKKRGELLSDIDLDMPPEPPKMFEKEISREEPIDEELMLPAKFIKSKAKAKKEELPELPPLPEMEEEIPPLPEEEEFGQLPELPPLTEEQSKEFEEGLELPPPSPVKKERKGFFSFLRAKKKAKELELPELGEIPEMPPLPSVEEEFPSIPSLKETPTLPELEEMPIEPVKPAVEKPLSKKEISKEKPIKRFIAINEFKQIQSGISNMKGILKGTDDFFAKLGEVKNIEDRAYIELSNDLQDIQRKIMFVDKTLFKE